MPFVAKAQTDEPLPTNFSETLTAAQLSTYPQSSPVSVFSISAADYDFNCTFDASTLVLGAPYSGIILSVMGGTGEQDVFNIFLTDTLIGYSGSNVDAYSLTVGANSQDTLAVPPDPAGVNLAAAYVVVEKIGSALSVFAQNGTEIFTTTTLDTSTVSTAVVAMDNGNPAPISGSVTIAFSYTPSPTPTPTTTPTAIPTPTPEPQGQGSTKGNGPQTTSTPIFTTPSPVIASSGGSVGGPLPAPIQHVVNVVTSIWKQLPTAIQDFVTAVFVLSLVVLLATSKTSTARKLKSPKNIS